MKKKTVIDQSIVKKRDVHPMQKHANNFQKKVYVYRLQNGNDFATVKPMTKNEMIMGSKIDKLIEIVKPQKIEGAK